jgi:hypothetical protein
LQTKSPAPPCGIQLYTVRDDMNKDAAGTLQKLFAIGYREVEVADFAGLGPAQLGKLIRDAGLRVPSAHLPFELDDTAKLLDEANLLGVRFVVSSTLLPEPPASGDFEKSLPVLSRPSSRL